MLTVKHIGTDGVETIMEAERVEKVCAISRFEDGIYIDRAPASLNDESSPQPRSFRHCIRYAETRSAGDVDPTVYVMNCHGSTVAIYHL